MPLPGWQQAIRREVRQLVHAAGSPVTDTIKRTNRPCFVLEGCIPLRPGASVPRPEGIITGGPASKTAPPWPSGTAKQSPHPR
jgi:hypothetical protein